MDRPRGPGCAPASVRRDYGFDWRASNGFAIATAARFWRKHLDGVASRARLGAGAAGAGGVGANFSTLLVEAGMAGGASTIER